MFNFCEEEKKYLPNWLLDVAIIFVIMTILFSIFYLIFENKYKDRVYPGLYLGEIYLGGKTSKEVKELINKKVNELNQNGITFFYNDYKATVMPVISSLGPGLAYEVINFDVEGATSGIHNFGRNKGFLSNLKTKISALSSKKTIVLHVSINEEKITEILEGHFSQYNMPAEDAKLILKKQNLLGGLEYIKFDIQEEKLGKIITYQKGLSQLDRQLSVLNFDSIQLFTKTDYPKIHKKDCLNIDIKTQKILESAPLILKYGDEEWNVAKEKMAEWISLIINPEYSGDSGIIDKIIVGLSHASVEKYLEEEIAININKEPIDARFKIKDGRVIEFQENQDGIELNINESIKNINSAITSSEPEKGQSNEIELSVRELKSNNSVGDVNDLGVKEIIGTGESNFAGSPSNRRHNIRVGTDSLNGILVKPGEEFSLLDALGEINGEAGYLQELVIKDNKTIPEYGGGLCQIGTTVFRAAIDSGLEITLRRNHSYRVSYYEPAGTDATIYSPWPDFKFLNNTEHNLLIQSRIDGNELYFDFWGTKDGRIVEKTDPVIYNIVKPGPTKLIETLDLKPGEKKCTEHAHNGADAYFDYKVTYPDGEIKEERFSSHYVPWREVCLIGVEELSEEKEIATTTEEVIE